MELHEALLRAKFDVRLIDWHIKQGMITLSDFEKHLKSLPDSTAYSLSVNLDAADSFHDRENLV